MTISQQIITVAMVILATMLTRFLPFLIFPAGRPTPKYVQYLGRVLPSAVFGLLIIYCLKNVSIFTGSRGLPELIAIVLVIILHLWKRPDCCSPSREGPSAICFWYSLCSKIWICRGAWE